MGRTHRTTGLQGIQKSVTEEGVIRCQQPVPGCGGNVVDVIQLAYLHGTSMPQRTGRREACLPPAASEALLLSPLQEGSAAVLTQQLPHLLQRVQGCIVMGQGCRGRCSR